jgi:hypothetical protein
MCGALLRDWWKVIMRKGFSSTPSSGFKGLPIWQAQGKQPLVAANFSSHFPSSLRGSVKGEIRIDSAKHCCIPEAISLHHSSDESSSTVMKTLHSEVKAGRLPRRLFPANDTGSFISQEFNTKTLLAMTKGNANGVLTPFAKKFG